MTKQRWGLMSLGLKETVGNEAKSKCSFRTAQKKIVFMTNFDYKKRKKNQDANAIEQGSNRRSEVNRRKVPGPPLNLRSFT